MKPKKEDCLDVVRFIVLGYARPEQDICGHDIQIDRDSSGEAYDRREDDRRATQDPNDRRY